MPVKVGDISRVNVRLYERNKTDRRERQLRNPRVDIDRSHFTLRWSGKWWLDRNLPISSLLS